MSVHRPKRNPPYPGMSLPASHQPTGRFKPTDSDDLVIGLDGFNDGGAQSTTDAIPWIPSQKATGSPPSYYPPTSAEYYPPYSNSAFVPQRSMFPRCRAAPLIDSAVHEAAAAIQADPAMALASALGAVSIVLQGLIDVDVPLVGSTPVSLMILNIADSGERKTALEKTFIDPIRTFQERSEQDYEQRLSTWEGESEIRETKIKGCRQAILKRIRDGQCSEDVQRKLLELMKAEGTERPRRFKMVYMDTTLPALLDGLHENLPTAGLVSSEASSMLNRPKQIPEQVTYS